MCGVPMCHFSSLILAEYIHSLGLYKWLPDRPRDLLLSATQIRLPFRDYYLSIFGWRISMRVNKFWWITIKYIKSILHDAQPKQNLSVYPSASQRFAFIWQKGKVRGWFCRVWVFRGISELGTNLILSEKELRFCFRRLRSNDGEDIRAEADAEALQPMEAKVSLWWGGGMKEPTKIAQSNNPWLLSSHQSA